MKISTKGRYALRMLVDLAQNQGDGYVSLKDIAERQGVSKKYLEQIVPLFNGTDVIIAGRGAQGGYRLLKSPDKYTVGYILGITEGSFAPVSCVESEYNTCPRKATCSTLFVWQGLYDAIIGYLNGITLQDIVDRGSKSKSFDYII